MYSIRFQRQKLHLGFLPSSQIKLIFRHWQSILGFCLCAVLQRMKSGPYSLSRHLWTRTNSTAGSHTICQNIPASQTHTQFCFQFTCSLHLPPFLPFPLKCTLELKKTQVWGKLWLDETEGGLLFIKIALKMFSRRFGCAMACNCTINKWTGYVGQKNPILPTCWS